MGPVPSTQRHVLGETARWSLAAAAALLSVAPWPDPFASVVALLACLLLLPPYALPSLAVLALHGFGVAVIEGPIIGHLRITDLCLMVFVAEHLMTSTPRARRPAAHIIAGYTFLGWIFLVSFAYSVSLTPVLRLGLYVTAGFCLAAQERSRRILQYVIIAYACVELTLSLPSLPARLIGATIGDPAQFGGLLTVAAALVVLRVRLPALRVPIMAYLLVGIYFSQTRSVWFSAIAVIVVLFLRRGGWAVPLLVPLIGSLLAWMSSQAVTRWAQLNQESYGLRIDSLRTGLAMVRAHPLAGQGWADFVTGTVGGTGATSAPYNIWLFVAASTGLVGVALFAIWLITLVRGASGADQAGWVAVAVMLAMGASEMPVYAGALLSLVLLLLIPPQAEPVPGRVPVPVQPPVRVTDRIVASGGVTRAAWRPTPGGAIAAHPGDGG